MIDYNLICKQVDAIASADDNAVGLLANTAALLIEAGRWHWVGFYMAYGSELRLGPFQGPLACMKIPVGKGVCGTAWQRAATLIVPDVEQFPGHIACSALSRSEIVVPIVRNGVVLAVLDIDSTTPDAFTHADAEGLEALCAILAPHLPDPILHTATDAPDFATS